MKIFPLFPARKSKPCPQIDKTQADSTVPDDLIHKTITERIEAGSDGRETVEAEIKTEPEKGILRTENLVKRYGMRFPNKMTCPFNWLYECDILCTGKVQS